LIFTVFLCQLENFIHDHTALYVQSRIVGSGATGGT
jgi:hypothetical protein